MNALCPSGHASAATDYCDQCGALIAGPATAPASRPTDAGPVVDEVNTSTTTLQEPCPACRGFRSGDDRFCERCGYDFVERPDLRPPASRPAVADWEAVASADRGQFDRYAIAGVEFPASYPPRRFHLAQAQVRIGRSRARPGEPVPEIDLAGAPDDPAVSRMHAVLERQGDGSYALRDLGSTNGTTLNDDPTPIGREILRPLADGDRIRIGAWTTITLGRR